MKAVPNLPGEPGKAVIAFQKGFNLEDMGAAMFADRWKAFQRDVNNLTNLVVAGCESSADLQPLLKVVRDANHRMYQACEWSPSPTFDMSCVAFASVVASVCQAPMGLQAAARGSLAGRRPQALVFECAQHTPRNLIIGCIRHCVPRMDR